MIYRLILVAIAIGQPGPAAEEKSISADRWITGIESERDLVEGMGPLRLLDLPAIRAELKIDEEQYRRYQALVREVQANNPRRTHFSTRDEASRDRLDHRRRVRIETRRALTRVFSAEQARRLVGLYLQLVGPIGLDDELIQDYLNISPERREAIAEIKADYITRLKVEKRQLAMTYLGPNAVATPVIGRIEPPKPGDGLDQPGVTEAIRDAAFQQIVQQIKSQRNNDPYVGVPVTPRETPKAVADQLDRQVSEFDKVRDEAARRIVRRLTNRQRDLVKKLQGEPFEGLTALNAHGPRPKPEDAKKPNDPKTTDAKPAAR